MKKMIIVFLFVSVLLAGCASSKAKMSSYAEKEMKKEYGVEVKTINVEPSGPLGPMLIAFFSTFFGKSYDLTFETVNEPKIVFHGSIHSGDFNQFKDEYVSAKHKWLLQHDEEYKRLYTILEDNGFREMNVFSAFTTNKEANITFKGLYKGAQTNVDELVETMNKMASITVRDVPFETSLSFKVDAKQYGYVVEYKKEDFQRAPVEFDILSYELHPADDFHSVLAEQLVAIHSSELMNEKIVHQLNELNFTFSSELGPKFEEKRGSDLAHIITLYTSSEYNEDRLLQAIHLLRDAGMDEAYLHLVFPGEPIKERKIKEINCSGSIRW
ncbi:hypothetical protein [Bacillus sp. REN10]|uniref:hypothetical protein n=1 Tax=Bacillus sp. REN10 TaxID=2782541 RepID=UPI00193AEC8D|nr:hypothetical protein [Bacillus sp. REN10]